MKRREFIGAGAAMAASGAAPELLLAQAPQVPAGEVVAPGEKVAVGFIGVGQRGSTLLKEFLQHDDVEVAAVCDVDSTHLDRAALDVNKARGQTARKFSDFRKLLELKELDAVVIATPDHWHALASIHSLDAGKDVYVEKPLCHSLAEGKAMIEAARRNKRVTQMGTQIHNDPSANYARVAKTVQSGLLGKIMKVRCWKYDMKQNLGNPPDGPPPATLDYDMWLGPAPARPYNPNRSHFKFRFFWDYAGGKFSDFGAHIMDIAFWSMGCGSAKSAQAIGGRFVTQDNTETPDTLEVLFEYDDFTMVWSQTVGNTLGFYDMGGIGCIFQGTDATLVTNYTEHKIFREKAGYEEMPKPKLELPPQVSHSREFINAIKSREQPSCNIEYGFQLTTNIHLGNIAYRTGTKVHWDREKQTIVNNPAAEALMRREYRAPWKLA